MRPLYLAALTIACLSAPAEAKTRYSILNTQDACRCGAECPCVHGECDDPSCGAQVQAEAPSFMAGGPVRRALAEAKPVRRIMEAVANIVRHRPKLLRKAGRRVFGGCGR